MELDLKAMLALPPIKERKTGSPDSLEGSFFINKSALEHEDNDTPSYTELKYHTPRSLPPLKGVASPMESTGSLVRSGILPPLYPPGHSQESLNDNTNEQTTAL